MHVAYEVSQQRLVIYVALTVGRTGELSDLNATPRPGPGKRIFAKRPPEVSPFYVPRNREWVFLVRHLIDSTERGRKIVSITGLGGCGKTQLVSHFLKEKNDL